MPNETKPVNVEALKALVRTVPDFPKPGILFYDITTLLKDKTGFAQLIDALAAHVRSEGEPAGGGGKPQTGLRQTLERLHALLLQLRRGQGSLAPGEFNSLEDALLNHIQLECRGRT